MINNNGNHNTLYSQALPYPVLLLKLHHLTWKNKKKKKKKEPNKTIIAFLGLLQGQIWQLNSKGVHSWMAVLCNVRGNWTPLVLLCRLLLVILLQRHQNKHIQELNFQEITHSISWLANSFFFQGMNVFMTQPSFLLFGTTGGSSSRITLLE